MWRGGQIPNIQTINGQLIVKKIITHTIEKVKSNPTNTNIVSDIVGEYNVGTMFTPDEYLAKSRRYRLTASQLNDPIQKQNYIDRANHFERLASPPNVQPMGEDLRYAGITDQNRVDVPNEISVAQIAIFPTETRIHYQLANEILKRKTLDRAFALWVSIRTNQNGNRSKSVVIEYAMRMTGKSLSTIYKWLADGAGIFWHIQSNDRLYIIGKQHVFNKFVGPDVQPGRVMIVPTELILNPRLHVLRAYLGATFLTGDDPKIIARITRRNIVNGISERTQLDMDKIAGVGVTPQFIRSEQQKNQLPNAYVRPNTMTTLVTDKSRKTKFYHLRRKKFQNVIHVQSDELRNGNDVKFGKRIYFSNQKRAIMVAEHRQQNGIDIPVYWVTQPDKLKSDRVGVATWLH